jgi:hypothetical protein
MESSGSVANLYALAIYATDPALPTAWAKPICKVRCLAFPDQMGEGAKWNGDALRQNDVAILW